MNDTEKSPTSSQSAELTRYANISSLPWGTKDKCGGSIETFKGKPFFNALRFSYRA